MDVLSNGRLNVGIAVGYIPAEFATIGVPLAERGARMDEYLAAMHALWTMDEPAFEGRFVSFNGVDAHPRPLQKPTPRIVFGGDSDAAFRRSVTSGHGWYGFGMTLDSTTRCIDAIRQAEQRHGRPTELGKLDIIVTPTDGQSPDMIGATRTSALTALLPYRPMWIGTTITPRSPSTTPSARLRLSPPASINREPWVLDVGHPAQNCPCGAPA